MKTKLLKKVRKRFEIVYYPNGDRYNDFPYIVVNDTHLPIFKTLNSFVLNDETDALGEALKKAKSFLLCVIRKEYYKHSKIAKTNYNSIKLWHS